MTIIVNLFSSSSRIGEKSKTISSIDATACLRISLLGILKAPTGHEGRMLFGTLITLIFALALHALPSSAQVSRQVQPHEAADPTDICKVRAPLLRSEHTRDGREVKVKRGEVALELSLNGDGRIFSAKYISGFPLNDDYKFAIKANDTPLSSTNLFISGGVEFEGLVSLNETFVVTAPAILSISTSTARGTAVSDFFSISPLTAFAGCGISSAVKFEASAEHFELQQAVNSSASMPSSHMPNMISFDDFEKCYNEGGAFYNEQCFGSSVIVTGYVSRYSADGVLLTLRKNCDSERVLNVDVENLRSEFFVKNEDKCVRLRVKIGHANFATPDVLLESVEWIESDSERAKRISQKVWLQAQENLRQEEERRHAENRKEELLEIKKNDADWLNENYYSQSQFACRIAVEKLAKWDFEWIEKWYEEKFTSYLVRTKAPYVVTITGDSIKMQNGFGAWKKVNYACDYNAKFDRASAYLR